MIITQNKLIYVCFYLLFFNHQLLIFRGNLKFSVHLLLESLFTGNVLRIYRKQVRPTKIKVFVKLSPDVFVCLFVALSSWNEVKVEDVKTTVKQ